MPRSTRYVCGALRFAGFAYRNPTAARAMRAVIEHAARQGRFVRWVSGVAS